MIDKGPDTDFSVLNWPEKLREVAAECDRAINVLSKPTRDRTAAESLYPGMPAEPEA